MVESFLDGVRWGLFLIGVVSPALAVVAVSIGLGRLFGREPILQGELIEDDEDLPDLDFEGDPETFNPEVDVRYMPSTIVRPPNVVSREDVDDDDQNES